MISPLAPTTARHARTRSDRRVSDLVSMDSGSSRVLRNPTVVAEGFEDEEVIMEAAYRIAIEVCTGCTPLPFCGFDLQFSPT